jgi:aromatic ring-opening dioxygenase LigB subunit
MKKSLLLDADVIIDLHSMDLFDKMAKAYNLKATRKVCKEAKFYYRKRKKLPIDLTQKIAIIENVDIDRLGEVHLEAKEAQLMIDEGEATSLAYIAESKEDITFCTCDRASIKLISYMNLEKKSISLETALRKAGHHVKLFSQHHESNFKDCVREGKVLRVQRKLI